MNVLSTTPVRETLQKTEPNINQIINEVRLKAPANVELQVHDDDDEPALFRIGYPMP